MRGMRITLLPSLLLSLAGAAPAAAKHVEVLFLGNSYTASNQLPLMVEGLATSAGHTILRAQNTPGGTTLGAPQGGQEHVHNPTSLALIASRAWDHVVLQEQSYLPTIDHSKTTWMVPAATTLDGLIHQGAPESRTTLFLTWGRRDGGQFCDGAHCSPLFPDYFAMQDALDAAYFGVAAPLGADVAPVGVAWRRARTLAPTLDLYAADGSHPNVRGSYLAACVFYAVLYEVSPVLNPFTAGVPAAEALFLQQCAAEAVFGPTCGSSPYSGAGLPGSNVLALDLIGSPSIGTTVTLRTTGLAPSAVVVWHLLATDDAALPFAGGTLLVDPATLVIPPFTIAAVPPSLLVPLPIPADPALTGVTTYWQTAAPDANQPEGLALSNGLRLTVCP